MPITAGNIHPVDGGGTLLQTFHTYTTHLDTIKALFTNWCTIELF